jgi:energy-coupling factor transport system substrate-specific component
VLTASFQQSLISDPIDKVTTFLIVFLILLALPRRTTARFPQGDRLLADEEPMGGPA